MQEKHVLYSVIGILFFFVLGKGEVDRRSASDKLSIMESRNKSLDSLVKSNLHQIDGLKVVNKMLLMSVNDNLDKVKANVDTIDSLATPQTTNETVNEALRWIGSQH